MISHFIQSESDDSGSRRSKPNKHQLWAEIRMTADLWCRDDNRLSRFLDAEVLGRDSFESAIAQQLAKAFASDRAHYSLLENEFADILLRSEGISEAICADLSAIQLGDPAAVDLLTPFLFFKGFAALSLHRIANHLWRAGREPLALLLQNRCSVVTGIDIHPAATLGHGILMDHATGVVIGETATIGNDVTIFHNVTLGGTGRDRGRRHPQVGQGVFIGAGATLLGCIHIGDWSRIGAGSVVLSDVAPWSLAVGVPARCLGISENDIWPDPRRAAALATRDVKPITQS